MTALVPPPFDLNLTPHIEVWTLDGGQPVFVVDDALKDPETFVDYAASQPFQAPPANSRYPGLVARIPDSYRNLVLEVLRRPMVQVFGMPADLRPPSFGFFGLATVPSSQMAPAQIAPHTDAHRANSFATVHYLCNDSFGGTAFYRHKVTGLEVITPLLSDKFSRARRQELAGCEGQSPKAIRDLYEEIGYVEAKFNRLILYRSGLLHSARMGDSEVLSADPRMGRLTANLFFNT